MLAPGQVLDGRYEILAPLAEGGMGAVYRARRLLLGDEVAIKVVLPGGSGPGALERFLRESRACAQLRHPHIVSIFDYQADDPARPFLVMELLSGPSLRDELAARGRIPPAEVARLLRPIAAALGLAHARGIVHRDLKPANIVAHEFAPGERVYKIVDFGVANVRQPADETRLTGAHEFIGTVSYASPEQLAGGAVDARSDVYSLGVVLFELLTGRVPFEADDAMGVVAAHLSKPAPLPRDVDPALPPWTDVLVGRALAKAPGERWPDMASLVAALPPAAEDGDAAGRQENGGLHGTYEVGERLGPGRLGSVVHRGVHRALGHPVAIRIVRGRSARDAAVRARFLREARALQIAHPSIVQVRDYGEEGDLVYVVTDYIEGGSLREFLRRTGRLPWERLASLAAQLFDAAHVVHRRGGLLCGLTPDIVRVTADEDGERLMISSGGIWEAQDLLGTLTEGTLRGLGVDDEELRYVAPELLTGRPADIRSDVFTIGVLLYEMSTGALPFDAGSLPALLGLMLAGRVADPRTLGSDLPEAAGAAILTALAPAPEGRFASARAFAAAFGAS